MTWARAVTPAGFLFLSAGLLASAHFIWEAIRRDEAQADDEG